jgi:hypothetical protein
MYKHTCYYEDLQQEYQMHSNAGSLRRLFEYIEDDAKRASPYKAKHCIMPWWTSEHFSGLCDIAASIMLMQPSARGLIQFAKRKVTQVLKETSEDTKHEGAFNKHVEWFANLLDELLDAEQEDVHRIYNREKEYTKRAICVPAPSKDVEDKEDDDDEDDEDEEDDEDSDDSDEEESVTEQPMSTPQKVPSNLKRRLDFEALPSKRIYVIN